MTRGKIAEAKEKWALATKADPKFASAYYNLGNALEYEHKNSEAVNCWVKAITVNPNMSDAFYRIGAMYYKDNHLAQAHTMLKKAVDLDPEAEWVRDAKKSLGTMDSAFFT